MKKEELQSIIADVVGSALKEYDEKRKEQENDYINRDFIKNFLAQQQNKNTSPEKGIVIGQILRSLAACKGDALRAKTFVEKNWASKIDIEPVCKALSASDGSSAGLLLQEDYADDIIELLRPKAVIRSSNPLVVPMPNGTFTMPGLATGATSSYIGENQNIPASEQTVRDVKLIWRKLVTLVPVSNDLIRYASYNSDMIVRDDLVKSMATREDLAFLRGNGANDTPIGIRNLAKAGNVKNANGTISLANVTADLAKLVLLLLEADISMIRPHWFMAPRSQQYLMTVRDGNGNYAFKDEMVNGTLWGWPVKVTNQIPVNLGGGSDESEIYLVDMSNMIIGDSMRISVDASQDAAYHDGAAVQASFSRDQTVIRAISEHDFNTRHIESIAVLDQVKWTP